MSVIPMKKLTLIGMKNDDDAILSTFARLGCVHLDEMETNEFTMRLADAEKKTAISAKMDSVNEALVTIADCCNEQIKNQESNGKKRDKKEKVKLNDIINVSFGDFSDTERDEFQLFGGVIDKVLHLKNEIARSKDEIIKIKALKMQLDPYLQVKIPFDEINDTEYTSMLLGILTGFSENDFKALQESFPQAEFVPIFAASSCVMFCLCLKEHKNDILAAFNKYAYRKCSFDFGMTAKDKYIELGAEEKALNEKIDECSVRITEFKAYIPRLKVLYDFYSYNYQKAEADSDITFTSQTFQLKAWIPEPDEKRVLDELDKLTDNIIVYTEKPKREELPPTKLKSSAFVKPFVSITNMYSVTNYWERDNNKWVAVFYFLFFGFMLGDVGYGIIMSLCAFAAIKFLKPRGGTKNLILIIGLGGISTVFWGVVFGGWFSIQEGVPSAIINPLTQPMEMIGLSLGLGVIQIIVGLILGGIDCIINGKVWDAIFDKFSWVLFFVGLLCFVGGTLLGIELLSTIGLYCAIGGLAIVVLTAGRHKKGIGKVIGGLGGLYGIINYLSDILSYLRLFGLGLATGVIGMVFNQLGGMLLGGAGFPLGIIVLVAGHSLNIGINTLGAYVHDMRLQHIEFFGKYFVGEGIPFTPFAGEAKYVNIVESTKPQ